MPGVNPQLPREYEPSGQKDEEPQKPMTEAERRQSLFPGKKVEKWEQPLEDKTVQQQVSKESRGLGERPEKEKWFRNSWSSFPLSCD